MSILSRTTRAGLRLAPAPVIRVLLLLDKGSLLGKYGTRLLQDALCSDPEQMNVEIDVKLRDAPGWFEAATIDQYHEIWFFLAKERIDAKAGFGPLVPLTDPEVTALREWMDRGGGVLVAGDHASEPMDGEYEGLGGHVGKRIPRAGHMRAWDEPPGTGETIADTTDDAWAVNREGLEADAVPQRLLLPVFARKPHPVFRDSWGRILDRFPDHGHEGAVRVPARATVEREWPGKQAPTIIASGVDWRHGRTNELMAAWDGHVVPSNDDSSAFFGRILTDSSFHHYADENLVKIAGRDGEDWAKIREIFRNQVAWLAPPDIKRRYRERAFLGLLHHRNIAESRGLPDTVMGPIVGALLAEVLPGAWYHELEGELLRDMNAQRPRAAAGVEFAPILFATTTRHLLASAATKGLEAAPASSLPLGDVLGSPRVQRSRPYEDAVVSYQEAVAVRQEEIAERRRLGLRVERED